MCISLLLVVVYTQDTDSEFHSVVHETTSDEVNHLNLYEVQDYLENEGDIFRNSFSEIVVIGTSNEEGGMIAPKLLQRWTINDGVGDDNPASFKDDDGEEDESNEDLNSGTFNLFD